MKDLVLVYLVAGLSSRFKGKIKHLEKVGPNEETLVEYSLKQALPAGFNKIIFIVGNATEKAFKETFGNSYKGIPIEYALQRFDTKERNKPWGTLDALCRIKGIIRSPFVVCNGDDIYGREPFSILANHLRNKETNATIGYNILKVIPEEGDVNRGIFQVRENRIISIKETLKINKENLYSKGLSENSTASMNLFALQPEALDRLNEILIEFKEKHKGNRDIESSLPVELGNLIKNQELIVEIYTTPSKWIGITNPGDELKVREILQNPNL
jgi:NDP-sugar pyrophosphorylase family protein